jgi:hypothetical protein
MEEKFEPPRRQDAKMKCASAGLGPAAHEFCFGEELFVDARAIPGSQSGEAQSELF